MSPRVRNSSVRWVYSVVCKLVDRLESVGLILPMGDSWIEAMVRILVGRLERVGLILPMWRERRCGGLTVGRHLSVICVRELSLLRDRGLIVLGCLWYYWLVLLDWIYLIKRCFGSFVNFSLWVRVRIRCV